jgi:hypothetical protein
MEAMIRYGTEEHQLDGMTEQDVQDEMYFGFESH